MSLLIFLIQLGNNLQPQTRVKIATNSFVSKLHMICINKYIASICSIMFYNELADESENLGLKKNKSNTMVMMDNNTTTYINNTYI